MGKKEKIKTKFGTAKINKNGYYYITSRKEGNHSKPLHRLVFEDFYQTEIPSDWIIHHEDGNKTNNEIWNLVPMTREEHISLHKKNNQYWLGKHHSEESKRKIGASNKGKQIDIKHRINQSKNTNQTGYFRVHKLKCSTCKQGYIWKYVYYENNKPKSIKNIDLHKLEEKVLARGLEWFKLKDMEAKI